MMAQSSCCLNLSPPPGPSSLSTETTNIANWQKKKEISWRNQSVLGVACVIISIQMENINLGDIVLAEEFKENFIEISNDKAGMTRWSDKRSCMPWRLNSLETIVPENLPRPAARRRWEAVGFSGATAPAMKGGLVVDRDNNSCFSM